MKELDLIDAVSDVISSYLDQLDNPDDVEPDDMAENIVIRLKNLGVAQ
jgi:hypothetical protein